MRWRLATGILTALIRVNANRAMKDLEKCANVSSLSLIYMWTVQSDFPDKTPLLLTSADLLKHNSLDMDMPDLILMCDCDAITVLLYTHESRHGIYSPNHLLIININSEKARLIYPASPGGCRTWKSGHNMAFETVIKSLEICHTEDSFNISLCERKSISDRKWHGEAYNIRIRTHYTDYCKYELHDRTNSATRDNTCVNFEVYTHYKLL